MNILQTVRGPLALAMVTSLAGAAGAQAPGAIDPNTGELVSAQSQSSGACRLAPAAGGSRVVLHAAYEGEALSSATVAGQDAVTTLTHVDIERGGEPLYLVLSSSTPMIWSLRGDTSRVTQVALVSNEGSRERPAIGVIGAPAAKVRAFHARDCFRSFDDASSSEAARAASVVATALGRTPSMTTAYSAAAVSLPGGRATQAGRGASAPAGFDPALWTRGLRFHSAGVAQVNPAAVAGARAEAYQVLPGSMGLAQLTGRGALQALGGGEYRIRAPIARYPAGLTGAEAVRFQLARGVAAPAGAPGHVCVVAQGTGRVLANPDICSAALQHQPRRAPRD